MNEVLAKHLNTEIGMNIEKPVHIDTVQLIGVHEEYFTVKFEKNGNVYHVPYVNVSRIIEHPEGVTVGGLFHQKRRYALVIKIGHIVQHVQP